MFRTKIFDFIFILEKKKKQSIRFLASFTSLEKNLARCAFKLLDQLAFFFFFKIAMFLRNTLTKNSYVKNVFHCKWLARYSRGSDHTRTTVDMIKRVRNVHFAFNNCRRS